MSVNDNITKILSIQMFYIDIDMTYMKCVYMCVCVERYTWLYDPLMNCAVCSISKGTISYCCV